MSNMKIQAIVIHMMMNTNSTGNVTVFGTRKSVTTFLGVLPILSRPCEDRTVTVEGNLPLWLWTRDFDSQARTRQANLQDNWSLKLHKYRRDCISPRTVLPSKTSDITWHKPAHQPSRQVHMTPLLLKCCQKGDIALILLNLDQVINVPNCVAIAFLSVTQV